jgi:hypothetical protein
MVFRLLGIYRHQCLRLAIFNDLIIAMVTRIIGKEDLNASTVPYNSYKLNAQAYSIVNKVSNLKDKDFGGMHRGFP